LIVIVNSSDAGFGEIKALMLAISSIPAQSFTVIVFVALSEQPFEAV
jgi:hypothetical protein